MSSLGGRPCSTCDAPAVVALRCRGRQFVHPMKAAAGNKALTRGTARTMTALAVIYPISAHLAVLSGQTAWIAASVGLLVLLALMPALWARRPLAWSLLAVSCVALFGAATRGKALSLLFLPPILINGMMAWVFGRTLSGERMPLIERIVRALHGEPEDLDVAIITYARRLTFLWTVLFTTLAIVNFLLAALATPGGLLLTAGIRPPVAVPLSAWSLFANVLNYAIVGAMFAVEYQVRRKRFPQQSYRGFLDFLRQLFGVNHVFRPTGALSSDGQKTELRQP